MQNVKIENDKPFTGSVEWLKLKVEKMRFKFSHIYGVPAIYYANVTKNKETGEEKTGGWYTLIVMSGNPAMDYNMYDVCKKYKDCWITAPTSANEYEWGLFPYLTENARIYCERLIKHLADALMEKSSSDRETMSIRVIIENYTTMKIYIKNPHEILDEKVIGTVAWVKKELSRSKLVLNPFSIKSDSLPCVALVFPERTIQIAIANSSEYFRQNPLGMRQYSHNKDIYILYAKKDKDLRHDGLFGYLTPAAETIVDDIIQQCAESLNDFLNNDKANFKIEVKTS